MTADWRDVAGLTPEQTAQLESLERSSGPGATTTVMGGPLDGRVLPVPEALLELARYFAAINIPGP
jgi:hypothetical protein